MAKVTKVINTLLTGVAIACMLLIILGFSIESSETQVFDTYDTVYASFIYYLIFWGASILNIFTVIAQQIKKVKKVVNFVVVTIVSIAMMIGMLAYIGTFELLAEAEGMDTIGYTTLMSEELTEFVYNGIFIYGIITVFFMVIFIITPFVFKREPVAQSANVQNNQVNVPQANPQVASSNNSTTAPQRQAEKSNTTTNNSSPFEL